MKPDKEDAGDLTVLTPYRLQQVGYIPPLPANDQLERNGWRFAVDHHRRVIYCCKLESDQ